jgi:hypothetical protein
LEDFVAPAVLILLTTIIISLPGSNASHILPMTAPDAAGCCWPYCYCQNYHLGRGFVAFLSHLGADEGGHPH